MQIKTKTFVVTGAGSGIGRELTLQLPRQATRFIQKKMKTLGMP